MFLLHVVNVRGRLWGPASTLIISTPVVRRRTAMSIAKSAASESAIIFASVASRILVVASSAITSVVSLIARPLVVAIPIIGPPAMVGSAAASELSFRAPIIPSPALIALDGRGFGGARQLRSTPFFRFSRRRSAAKARHHLGEGAVAYVGGVAAFKEGFQRVEIRLDGLVFRGVLALVRFRLLAENVVYIFLRRRPRVRERQIAAVEVAIPFLAAVEVVLKRDWRRLFCLPELAD